MINGKTLATVLDKLLTKSEVAQNARIQVQMPNGDLHDITEIKLMEKPFDFKSLSDRLSRVFPGLVKIREDVGAIIVMDKIKVTQTGIEEGSGLAADRVKAIYDEFVRETKKSG